MSDLIPHLFRLACGGLLLLATPTDLAANPFSVWATESGVRVFSGPGNEYYATLDLPTGTELEVYETLPGGWLAIRPPAGSFSLVASSAIERVEGDIARVIRPSASSRVGSLLVPDHDVVHVRLEQGERVRLVDTNSDDLSAWAKIAPPPGEFRWVREKEVSREQIGPKTANSPIEAADKSPPKRSGWQERDEESLAPPRAPPIALPTGATRTAQPVEAASHDDWVAAQPSRLSPPTLIEVAAGVGAPAAVELLASPVPPVPPVQAPRNEPSLSAKKGRVATPLPVSAQASSFDQQVDQLEIQISRRIASPANLWLFNDLEKRTAQLLSLATTPEQIATLHQLAARLSRFTTLATRVRSSSDGESAEAKRAKFSSTEPSRHDAVGVLRPVVSKRGNAPPYALIDAQGDVVTFLTPSPSLNVQPYLGQRIGVSGTQDYLPEYRRKNIQTARITPIDGAQRR